jgi:uncharacterized RDD family membrane protein YckC
MVIASPWRRLVAFLVDIFLIVVLEIVLRITLAGVILVNTTPVQDRLFSLVLIWAYYVTFTALYGATPGKMLLGIRVVKSDGRPVDWLTALMREVVGKTLSTLLLYLGYLWAFFHPKRQTWHDLIANTLVIHREPEA